MIVEASIVQLFGIFLEQGLKVALNQIAKVVVTKSCQVFSSLNVQAAAC